MRLHGVAEGTTPPPLPTQLRPLEAHKLTASFTGRPSDALQSLPDGLTIHRSESPTAQTPGETWTSPVDAQVSWNFPLVQSCLSYVHMQCNT